MSAETRTRSRVMLLDNSLRVITSFDDKRPLGEYRWEGHRICEDARISGV